MIRALILTVSLLVPVSAKAEVNIQEVTSEDGITAWLVEERSIPFISLNIAFKGGASLDPIEQQGASYFMSGLLEEGAGERDSRAFAEELESLATQISFDLLRDSLRVEARFLTENTEASVELLKEALTVPRFDEEPIARVRSQILAGLESDAKDPGTIASQRLARLAYGDHPYGRAIEGTPDTIAAITRDDLLAAHKRSLTKDRVVVGVVGDISAEDLAPLLDKLFADLPKAQSALPASKPYDLNGGISIVDFPTPQSSVLFSHVGLSQDEDDFLKLFVLNHILGGSGFGSRLKQEVREARGLTYGIGTFPVAREYSAQWMGQFSSSNDVVAEAIDVVSSIWSELAENGPTEEEVRMAQTYLTGAYPLRFDGNSAIASILTGMQLQGLSRDYIVTRNDQIWDITPQELQDLAKELMDPAGLRFVVVGQPQGLEPIEN